MKFAFGFIAGILIMFFPICWTIQGAYEHKLSQCEKTCNDQREKLKAINSDTTHKHCLKIGK